MADFASVFQQANRPAVQFDPAQNMATALQMQGMMNQRQLQQMQIEQNQLAVQDANTMRQVASGIDWNSPGADQQYLKSLQGKISPQTFATLQENNVKQGLQTQQTNELALKNDITQRDNWIGAMRSITEDPRFATGDPNLQAAYTQRMNEAVGRGWVHQGAVPPPTGDKLAIQSVMNGVMAGSTRNKEASQDFEYKDGQWYQKSALGGPKALGGPIDVAAAQALIDKNIPATGSTANLNSGAKNEIAYWADQGRRDMVQKAIDNWLNKANEFEKITNPALKQAAIDKAAAEAAASTSARLKIEQANQTGAVAKLNPTAANAASDKYFKASQDFNIATQAADNMDSFIEAAKSGNKVAHGFLPTEGALEASTAQGVKRVNMAEIKSYGGAGSLMDRIEGQLKGLSTGQSIPPQILDDMKKVSDAIRRNATTKHESAVKAVNVSYGSSFEPLSKKSGAISLDDYLKQQGH